MKIKIIILLLLITAVQINAEVRFVSKTGSSAAPYTSWQTAADRIQKAIDISKRGDTIYVGNGTYIDTVRMSPGIALIGSGMDSCIINSQPFSYMAGFNTVTVNDSCILSGFHIIVSNDGTGCGVGMFLKGSGSIVQYNTISNSSYGVDIVNSSPVIRHNFLYPAPSGHGVAITGTSYNYFPQVDSNSISVENAYGIFMLFGAKPSVQSNTFWVTGYSGRAFSGGAADTTRFINNLVICNNCGAPIYHAMIPTISRNNVIIGKTIYSGIDGNKDNIIENNSITTGSREGLSILEGNPVIRYNNSWGNKVNFTGFKPDSTNISVDPMFVNPDNTDFHLQMYSPLIDAGNPDLKDVDGSRCDIGIYGGPIGESYTYKDLAPRSPQNLNLSFSNNTVILKWNMNTENDFSYYNIYRDTVKNFTVNKRKLLTTVKDTIYSDIIYASGSYYYKISAVDLRGNESAPGEESGAITGINEARIIIPDYHLGQNYPNPFNPSTKINYRLKSAGYVKINIYDIKGEQIKTIENRFMEAGFHEAEFNTNGLNLASGVYFYKIDVKNEKNIPVYTEIKKMLYLK